MDMLKETGQETNVNFLGSLSTISLESIGELFKGVKDFSKKFTLPFAKGKALLNLSDFLALPKNQAKLKKLNNPYEFYEKVMQDELRKQTLTADKSPKKDEISLHTIAWEQFGLSSFQGEQSPEELAEALEAGKKKIQEEIWTIEMVENPQTVQKILGVLEKSDTFFAQTQKLSDQLLETMDTPWEALKTLKSAIGIDIWKELKESKILWGVINFVLSLLGFSWGIEGVERAWKKKNLDKELKQPQKEYISEVYESYMKKKTLQDTAAQSLLSEYKLKVAPDQLSKFAIDLPLIKEQIIEKITENPDLINLSTLKSIKGKNFKGDDFVETIKEKKGSTFKLKRALSDQEKEYFINYYLQTMLQHFSDPKISKMLADADTLAFTMISWICLDKENVIEGVEAQVFLPEQFYETEKSHIENQPNESDQNLSWGSNEWLLFADAITDIQKEKINNELKNSPLNAEMLLNSSKKYWIPISYLMAVVKNDSSYWTAWLWARTHNPWNVGNTDDGSKRHFLSREEWLDAAAKVLKDRVEAYRKEYGDAEYPPIQSLLENRWPDGKGFLSSQGNYKQNNPYRNNPNKAPLWAYMTAVNWPQQVAKITQALNSELWLTLA